MARAQRNTSVDQTPLAAARTAEIDTAYLVAYREHPLDEPDEWGDLESFRAAVRG